jgi:hypothetical protein
VSTYFAGYGEAEERRSRWTKWLLRGLLAAIVLGVPGYFFLRNLPKRQKLDAFVERLGAKDYRAAYTLWGCTEQTPCRDYSFERFQRDFGPGGSSEQLPKAKLLTKATCGGIFDVTGILRVYELPSGERVSLWVNAQDGNIGFAPVIGRMQCTVLP